MAKQESIIKTINGIEGDANNNFALVAGDCIEIENDTEAHSITITETCSQPCCDSEQINIIKEMLHTLQTKINTIDNNTTTLNTVTNALATIIQMIN